MKETKYQAMVEEKGGILGLIEDGKETIITLDMMKEDLQTGTSQWHKR